MLASVAGVAARARWMSKDAGLLDASMFRRLAEQLREWSTTILAAADAGEVERTRETLQLHVDLLDESADAVRPEAFETSTWQASRLGRGGGWNKTLREFGNYGLDDIDVRCVVKCIGA